MKKRINKWMAVLLCVVLLIGSLACFASAQMAGNALEPDCVYLGDVDENGRITAVDARWVLQAASKVRSLSDALSALADVNRDGFVTAVDARQVLQMASGARAKRIYNTVTGEVAEEVRTVPTTQAEILAYFNEAMNDVKPNAKRITLTREVNSKAGEMQGDLSETVRDMVEKLMESNMGEVDVSAVAPAVTVADKNALFPVAGESWSSRLSAEDILSATLSEADGIYTIQILVKEDGLSADTAAGVGHNGKVFSVITPALITENAGSSATLITNVQTAHRNGRVTVTVDSTTNHVLTANYYFVWEISLNMLGYTISFPCGSEQTFAIEW